MNIQENGLPRLIPLAKKSGVALVDQTLFAGGNFLLHVLLARWLAPVDYGAFALAFSVFLLFMSLHNAILVEPMVVFGAGKYAEFFERYVPILVRIHFGLMIPGTLLLLGLSFLLGRFYSPSVRQAFFGLALAAPFILLLWLVRRASYVRFQPGWSTVGAALYFVSLLSFLFTLQMAKQLSLMYAFLAMGAAALVASSVLLFRFRLTWGATAANPTLAMIATDHWSYGRWALPTAGLMWLPSNIYYVFLPAWIGLEGTGALRALNNLTLPVLHAMSAISLLLLPLLARTLKQSGVVAMSRIIKISLLLFLAASGIYLILLWVFRAQILQLLYGGRYDGYASWPLLLAGLLPLSASVVLIFADGLRALERPDRIFRSYVVSCLVAVTVGIPLAATSGVAGALGGLLISSLLTGLLIWLAYLSVLRQLRTV